MDGSLVNSVKGINLLEWTAPADRKRLRSVGETLHFIDYKAMCYQSLQTLPEGGCSSDDQPSL